MIRFATSGGAAGAVCDSGCCAETIVAVASTNSAARWTWDMTTSFNDPWLFPEPGDRLDLAGGVEREHVGASGALLAIGTDCNPFRQYDSLAVPDRALALQAQAGHEALRGAEMRNDFAQPLDSAEAVPEADIGVDDRPEDRLAFRSVGDRPGPEPRIDGLCRLVMRLVGGGVGDERL